MARIVIVDDSIFMRRSLAAIFAKHPDIEIVGMASNGEEALRMVKELDPDLVTMDVEMPRMDGVTALQHIMAENPVPVIMVSSLTAEGAEVTLKALEYGALDYMAKLSAGSLPAVEEFGAELVAKVRVLARRKAIMRLSHRNRQSKVAAQRVVAVKQPDCGTLRSKVASIVSGKERKAADDNLPRTLKANFDVVCIGVSTGGPPAIQKVLEGLPANFPAPILISQHMPAAFTGLFAKRLDSQCILDIKEAEDGENIRPGFVYICPGGRHMHLEKRGATLKVHISDEPADAIYRPSVNVLMATASKVIGRRVLGVMLTGMGDDGCAGSKELKERGGVMLAQNEASCVVYGMPKAIVDANLADEIVDIDDMSKAILKQFS